MYCVCPYWMAMQSHSSGSMPSVHGSQLTRHDPTFTGQGLYPLTSTSHLLATPLPFSLSLYHPPSQISMSVPLIRVQRVAPVWIRWTASSASARSSGWGLLASWVRAPWGLSVHGLWLRMLLWLLLLLALLGLRVPGAGPSG